MSLQPSWSILNKILGYFFFIYQFNSIKILLEI